MSKQVYRIVSLKISLQEQRDALDQIELHTNRINYLLRNQEEYDSRKDLIQAIEDVILRMNKRVFEVIVKEHDEF